MYRMLIAEQDKEQVEKISEYVKSKWKKIEIVQVVETGYAALEYLENNKVDILVIAVNLIGVSGLEVARIMRKKQPEIHILMISAYDYAEFLKEAMSYGVSDYLIKPLNMLELSDVIERMIKELDGKKARKEKKNVRAKRDDQVNVFMDYSFIYTFMWNEKSNIHMQMLRDLLGLDAYGYVLNIEFVKAGERNVIDEDTDFVIIAQAIKDILSDGAKCVVGPKLGKRIIVYVSQNEAQYKNRENVTEALVVANKLRVEFARCFDLEVRVGLGSVRKLEEIHSSYEESIKSLRYMCSSNVMHINDIALHGIPHKEYMEVESSFLQNAKLGKQECFEQYEVLWGMISNLKLYDAKNKVLEILVVLCREARLVTENEVSNLDYNLYVRQMEALDWVELKNWSYVKIDYILKAIRTCRGGVKSMAVKEAVAYMNEHYNEELTLGFISSLVNMTPQHFCKIFKESTKVTYIDYLKKIRVEHAKELLIQGKMTISQISDRVGYRDPNYFGSLFKKTVGKSPSQFQKEEGRS